MRSELSFLAIFFLPIAFGSVSVSLTDNVTVIGTPITAGNRKVHRYSGIPYAHRSELLMAPEELIYPTKETIIDATTAGAVCPQVGGFRIPKEAQPLLDALMENGGAKEDAFNCASLDIYVPAAPGNKKRNVVIYVHGGGMDSGSRFQALTRADKIHRFDELKETIWINVGYSLGPLGFWAIRDKDGAIQANAAIYEIIRAIKWVHDYIPKFGGDTDDITLIGHSAGAALVQTIHFMLRNPNKFGFTQQPFHKMALMSGSSYLFSPISFEDALARQEIVISKTPCKDLPSEEQNACMKGLDDRTIIEATRDADTVWGPVVDGVDIEGDTEMHLNEGKFLKKVKVMATITTKDSSLFCIRMEEVILQEGHKFWGRLGHKAIVAQFEENYPPSKSFGGCKYKALVHAATDAIFARPALRSAELYSKNGLEVVHHEFDFILEHLTSTLGYLAVRVMKAVLKFDVDKTMKILLSMGTFHGLEQSLLFDPPLIANGYVTVGTLSTNSQTDKVCGPVFEFIKTGTAKSANPIRDTHEPSSLVNVSDVVKMLYTGKMPITAFDITKPTATKNVQAVDRNEEQEYDPASKPKSKSIDRRLSDPKTTP
jgi:carboxylesterase type B